MQLPVGLPVHVAFAEHTVVHPPQWLAVLSAVSQPVPSMVSQSAKPVEQPPM
jgi:hypothetical protein